MKIVVIHPINKSPTSTKPDDFYSFHKSAPLHHIRSQMNPNYAFMSSFFTMNYLSSVRVVKSKKMRWAGHVARMGQGRGVYRVLVGKPEGKRQMGRPRRRWDDNIKMDLQEVGGGCGDWKELAQDRDRWRALVSKVMNLRVPKMRGISWLAAEPVSFSRTLLHGISKHVSKSVSNF